MSTTPDLIKRCGDMIACNAAETLERDTFKSASEARDFGLIDEVIDKRPLDQPVAKWYCKLRLAAACQ